MLERVCWGAGVMGTGPERSGLCYAQQRWAADKCGRGFKTMHGAPWLSHVHVTAPDLHSPTCPAHESHQVLASSPSWSTVYSCGMGVWYGRVVPVSFAASLPVRNPALFCPSNRLFPCYPLLPNPITHLSMTMTTSDGSRLGYLCLRSSGINTSSICSPGHSTAQQVNCSHSVIPQTEPALCMPPCVCLKYMVQ